VWVLEQQGDDVDGRDYAGEEESRGEFEVASFLRRSSISRSSNCRGLTSSFWMSQYPKKTVFFMTAQTLANDISKGILDAREIILLVVGSSLFLLTSCLSYPTF